MTAGSVLCVIPARMGATRLPGKPLADIGGRPMIHWVWEAARAARGIDRVVVATESPEVEAVARGFGAEVAMTHEDHSSGTDRVAEAVRALDASPSIVVNLQGDEPLLPPSALERLIDAIRAGDTPMATLVAPFDDLTEVANPARVKVVARADGRALYFSRLAVPCDRDGTGRVAYLRHVGVYAFAREFLEVFTRLPPSPLEQAERLEQLRALEAGHEICLVSIAYDGFGIDTPADLERVRAILAPRRESAGTR